MGKLFPNGEAKQFLVSARESGKGTQNLLMRSRDHGIKNFVFASTSSVYGLTETMPFVETDPCDTPISPYSSSKRACELMGFTYHHLFGLKHGVEVCHTLSSCKIPFSKVTN